MFKKNTSYRGGIITVSTSTWVYLQLAWETYTILYYTCMHAHTYKTSTISCVCWVVQDHFSVIATNTLMPVPHKKNPPSFWHSFHAHGWPHVSHRASTSHAPGNGGRGMNVENIVTLKNGLLLWCKWLGRKHDHCRKHMIYSCLHASCIASNMVTHTNNLINTNQHSTHSMAISGRCKDHTNVSWYDPKLGP